MRVLVINPNTNAVVTELLRQHVGPALARLLPGVQCDYATARLGGAYIASEASYALAAHATLDAWAMDAQARGAADAVLVGCFGDPGVFALRELVRVPVLGLAEAAMREADALTAQADGIGSGGRGYRIVTGGAAWAPMLRRLAQALGLDARLLDVQTVAPSGVELASQPEQAIALLRTACTEAAEGAAAVILGGAGLAGMAASIEPGLGVPLVDSVLAGARQLAAQITAVQQADGAVATTQPAWSGLSAELLAALGPRP